MPGAADDTRPGRTAEGSGIRRGEEQDRHCEAGTKHPPANTEAKAAQDAAAAPPNDKEAQAKEAKADEMGAAKPAPFDKAAFIAAVNKAIAAQASQNLDEADKFASSDKADNVKAEVMGKVTKGKDESAKPIAETSQQAPDTSKAVDKPVTPLPDKEPEAKPVPLDADKAMPPKAPAEQTNSARRSARPTSRWPRPGSPRTS